MYEKIPLVMFIQNVKHGIEITHIFLGLWPEELSTKEKCVGLEGKKAMEKKNLRPFCFPVPVRKSLVRHIYKSCELLETTRSSPHKTHSPF